MVFAVFLSVMLSAMAWVSYTVLRLEQANAEVQREVAIEEVVRLALWRMDAAISPLIIEESARPYFDYVAFNPAKELFPTVDEKNAEQLVPSPLLVNESKAVNIYFNGIFGNEIETNRLSSPQVPEGKLQKWAHDNYDIDEIMTTNQAALADLNDTLSLAELNTSFEYNSQPIAFTTNSLTLTNGFCIASLDNHADVSDIQSTPQLERHDEPEEISRADRQIAANPQMSQRFQSQQPQQEQSQQQSYAQQMVAEQYRGRNIEEYGNRAIYNKKAQSRIIKSKKPVYELQKGGKTKSRTTKSGWDNVGSSMPRDVARREVVSKEVASKLVTPVKPVDESIMRLFWVNDLLLLARRVDVEGTATIQGAWLNWDHIRGELLADIKDLLPQAQLVPANPVVELDKSRMLASLPAKLIPGQPATIPPTLPAPLRLPLTVAWTCIILAAAAVALLLFGTLSLSERRAAFVSAVTHELRTPLTTFRMYTEMLAAGMVKDEVKSKRYLATLHAESNRLGHLVENVLAYARLERGAGARVLEDTSVAQIMDRASGHLATRTEETGMQLVIDVSDQDKRAIVRTDIMAVEQILFNLVDNACKYCVNAEDKRIHVAITSSEGSMMFRICDHGKGLKAAERSIAFKPFRKSAEKAAQTAPGVGLGLALCKRLAEQLGGSIAYEDHPSYGACFLLRLPRA